MAVGNDSTPAIAAVQRGADHTGLAGGQGRHGVEQVGKTADPCFERGTHLRIVGIAMPRADDKALVHQLANNPRLDRLRRNRQQRFALGQGRQFVEHGAGQAPQFAGVVNPATLLVQKRPFDMHAEHPGNPGRQRLAHRRHAPLKHRQIVADQRRQKPRGAEAAMRFGNSLYPRHRRLVVEQHAAAAVDLEVDKTRQQ